MKALVFILSLLTLLCYQAEAKQCGQQPLKIAVIDTGFGFQDKGHEARLCRFGHKNFSSEKEMTGAYVTKVPVPLDTNSHGTNVAGLIDQYAKEAHVDYCLVIVKYYSEKQTGQQNLAAVIKAFQYVTNIHVDYVNYSGGGPEFSIEEYNAVEKFLNQGGKFVSAAGNEHQDIDKFENSYYPAGYDPRIVTVGNQSKQPCDKSDKSECRSPSSNYGKLHVNRWEIGEDVTAFDITMTGTSQATAIATGKIVGENGQKCDIGF